MKKLLAISIASLALFIGNAQADPAVDALVADAVAACAKIETLQSSDILPMFAAANTINAAVREKMKLRNLGARDVRSVEVWFGMSDGNSADPLASKSFGVTIRYYGWANEVRVECSTGRVRIGSLPAKW